jgi:hypothetical protein
MFIGPDPEYAEELVNKREGKIYEELIDKEDGKIHLERVQTTTKQENTDTVNKMIKRGWRILSLENNADKGVSYVLGHEEQDAF